MSTSAYVTMSCIVHRPNVKLLFMKVMIRKAYKFKLKTSTQQSEQLAMYAGCCRFVWNKALSLNLFRLSHQQPIMYYQELDFYSKLWKKSEEYGFLKECPSQAIQQKLRD